MSSRIVKVSITSFLCLMSGSAFAIEPCHHGVPAIDIVQGSFVKAPGYISPDTQSMNPDGSVKQQGWHNLKKAARPLTVICRYSDKQVSVVLPDTIDTCVFGSSSVNCF